MIIDSTEINKSWKGINHCVIVVMSCTRFVRHLDHVHATGQKEGRLSTKTNSRGILKLSRAQFLTHDWLFYLGVGGSSFKIFGMYFRDDQSIVLVSIRSLF